MGTAPKLDHDQRMFVLRMFAEGHPITAIRTEIKTRFSIGLAYPTIKQTCNAKKYQSIVEQFRNSYLAKVKEVPIANKRYRLEDAEMMRQKVLKQIDKLGTPDKKTDKLLLVTLMGELRRINAEAREEMEKKPQLVQQAVINMGEMSDEQLFKHRDSLIREYRRLTDGDSRGSSADAESFDTEDRE